MLDGHLCMGSDGDFIISRKQYISFSPSLPLHLPILLLLPLCLCVSLCVSLSVCLCSQRESDKQTLHTYV